MKTPATRAVLYARLSITAEESVSIERQVDAGRKYADARGWEVVGTYVDDGVSASRNAPEDRPGWQDLLHQPKGTYDVVIIWKVDRLARRVLDFLNADRALQERGAAVVAVEDPVDMTTAQGRAFSTVLAVFAELEAAGIAARVKAARQALIRAGRVPGGAAPFGYYNAPNPDGPGKVLAKDPDNIGHVVAAVDRALAGDSLNSIGRYLDEVAPRQGRKNSAARWTTSVTKRMLQNPVLAGMTLHNPGNTGKQRGGEVLRGEDGMPIVRDDLAIVDAGTFRQLLARLEVKHPKATHDPSYLSGLVRCGHCDKTMHRNTKMVHGKRVHVFQCTTQSGGCGQSVSHLEEIVAARFLARFANQKTARWEQVTNDNTEIQHQINLITDRMRGRDADIADLAQTLIRLKANLSDQKREWRKLPNSKTGQEEWDADRRTALVTYTGGVQLVKGRVGSKFDQERLTFLARAVDEDMMEIARAAKRASRRDKAKKGSQKP